MSRIKKVLNSYLSKISGEIVFFFRGYRYHLRIVQVVAPSKSVLALGGQLKYHRRLYGEERVGDPHNTNVSGAPNDNFRKIICSEDDFRSRIFGSFSVKFLACLPLLGFSNIKKMV